MEENKVQTQLLRVNFVLWLAQTINFTESGYGTIICSLQAPNPPKNIENHLTFSPLCSSALLME